MKFKVACLKYAGPPLWGSYADILPSLYRAWECAGFAVVSDWFYQGNTSRENFEALMQTDVIIFPLGQIHFDGLKILSTLRKNGYRGRALIMCAGDGLKGQEYIKRFRHEIRRQDTLIVNCPSEKTLLTTQLPKSFDIRSIPLPVNTDFFKPASSALKIKRKKEMGFKKSLKYLMYAGRISSQKNILSLLSIFSLLKQRDPTWRLVVAGAVDDFGVPHIENQNSERHIHEISFWITKLGLKEDVIFTGNLDQLKLRNLFQAVDAVASLTLHSGEDFGYSIAQATAVDIPTVITKWGGGNFFVDSGLSQGVPVLQTHNGLKISYDCALEKLLSIQNQKSVRQRAVKILSETAISKKWKKLAQESTATNKLKNVSPQTRKDLLKRSKHLKIKPFSKNQQRDFLNFCENYGALSVSKFKTQKFYWNPLYLHAQHHLFDPNSFQRDFSKSKVPLAAKIETMPFKTIQFLSRNGLILPFLTKK